MNRMRGNFRVVSVPQGAEANMNHQPANSSRFGLLERRNSNSPIKDGNIPYHDMGETSHMGSLLVSVRGRNDFPYAREQLVVGIADTHPTDVVLIPEDVRDLKKMNVILSTRFAEAATCVFWHDEISEIDKRSYLIALRSLKGMIERMRNPGSPGQIRFRMLRIMYFEDPNYFSQFISDTNYMLKMRVPDELALLTEYPNVKDYSVSTYGQLLLAMLLSSNNYSYRDKVCGPPIRLMFLWLENFRFADSHAVMFRLFSALYERLNNNNCDSCFERILMSSESDRIPYPYALESFMTSNTRYISIRPSRSLDYELGQHDVARRSGLAWRNWEHNYISPTFVKGEMIFMVECATGDYVDVPVPQHWGMSLVQGLHFLQKGLKAARYGQGNDGLIRAVQEKRFHIDNCSMMKECIIDIWLIARTVPSFENFCINTAGLLTLCLIPRQLVEYIPEDQRDVDYFDTLVRYLFGHRIDSCVGIFRDLTVPSPNFCKARLDSEDVSLTLIHYQG
nr:TPA_asm: VP4 [Aedes orbi-like virus]